jgi:peptidoglycan-associated lipoprotein
MERLIVRPAARRPVDGKPGSVSGDRQVFGTRAAIEWGEVNVGRRPMKRICAFAIASLFVGAFAHRSEAAGTAPTGPPSAACPSEQAAAPAPPMAEAPPVQAVPCAPPNCTCVPYSNIEKQPVAGHEEPCPADCDAQRVHFAFDSAELDNDAKTILKRSAACLKTRPGYQMTIEGATDQRGSEEYNKALGQRRAQAVASFLEAQGVSSDRLKTISLGKGHPLCTEKTESCFSDNRRVMVRGGRLSAAAERTLE